MKCQFMVLVGDGVDVGLYLISCWNNFELEIVLVVDSQGCIKGVMLGNDVNLCDVEGCLVLLLGKVKDNNVFCSIGLMIWLFDGDYMLDDVWQVELMLWVQGEDGFVLNGVFLMLQISCDFVDLVVQMLGCYYQYFDGVMLFLGMLFVFMQDCGVFGQGFIYKLGDRVMISELKLGVLINIVWLFIECLEWCFGMVVLMCNFVVCDLFEFLVNLDKIMYI